MDNDDTSIILPEKKKRSNSSTDLRNSIKIYSKFLDLLENRPEPYTGTRERDRQKRNRAIASWDQKAKMVCEVYMMIYRRWFYHNKRPQLDGVAIPISRYYKRYNRANDSIIYGIVNMFFIQNTRGTFNRETGMGQSGLWWPRKTIKMNATFYRIFLAIYKQHRETVGKVLKTLMDVNDDGHTVIKFELSNEQIELLLFGIREQIK